MTPRLDTLLRVTGERGQVGSELAVSMDGHRLAAGRGEVGIWDLRTEQLLRTIEAHEQSVTAIAFSRDGRRLATAGGWDETVRVWDLASGSLIGRITTEPGMVHGLCISPDGRTSWPPRPERFSFGMLTHYEPPRFSPDTQWLSECSA